MRLGLGLAFLSLIGAPLLLASGCAQSCDQACVMRAQYIDNCLDEWGEGTGLITWSYTGYDSAETWSAVCQAEYDEAMKYASIEGQSMIRRYCADDIADLWQSNTCFDYTPSYPTGLGSQDAGYPTAGGAHGYELRPELEDQPDAGGAS